MRQQRHVQRRRQRVQKHHVARQILWHAKAGQLGDAGLVRFRLGNNGPSTHEFVVVRTDRASDKLPLQRDGLTVDEEGPGVEHVDEAEGLDIADHRTLTLSLAPGHYVLFCNMEGHYLGGMHAAFAVR